VRCRVVVFARYSNNNDGFSVKPKIKCLAITKLSISDVSILFIQRRERVTSFEESGEPDNSKVATIILSDHTVSFAGIPGFPRGINILSVIGNYYTTVKRVPCADSQFYDRILEIETATILG